MAEEKESLGGREVEKELTRAFICIEFPDEVIKEAARVQEVLENKNFTGKMTELENLHLTYKFLGEIDEKKLLINAVNFYEKNNVDWTDCLNMFLVKKAKINQVYSYDKGLNKFDWISRIEP